MGLGYLASMWKYTSLFNRKLKFKFLNAVYLLIQVQYHDERRSSSHKITLSLVYCE